MTLLPVAIGRSVAEWIGATPDAKIPPHVVLRIFRRYGGRCYLTGAKIMPGDTWEAEHIKALSQGGEHRESNLAPALTAPHKIKTARERVENAKADRIAKRHLGIAKSSARGFRKPDGTAFDWSRGRYVRVSHGPDRDAQTEIERGKKT